MSLVSWQFLIFVLVSVFFYYILPKKLNWIVLLLASLAFYSFGGIKVVVYLIFTILTTYFTGIALGKINKKMTDKVNKEMLDKLKLKKKIWVLFSVLSNFSVLFFFKYWNFSSEILNRIFKSNLPNLNLILPLGISFYIFQSIGYVIDIYRKKYEPEKNIFKYSLFVSFFPQMVQGPISRFNNLGKQLFEIHKFSFENIEAGIELLLWGYFKKLVIADRAAIIANIVFEGFENYSRSIILFGVIFYCIQLYCDFSGGIDITRGVARLFGIELVDNFKRPIFSTSLQDFWRRWHISLGTWMKDYLFYPLSLSKPFVKLGKFIRKHISGKAGQIIPVSLVTFIVYFAIGIWHGASFKYIAFGIWNGVIITASLLLEPYFVKVRKRIHLDDKNKWFNVFRIFRTSILVLIGRYITRAANFGTALSMLKKTLLQFNVAELFKGTLLNLGLTVSDYIIVAVSICFILIIEAFQEHKINLSEKLKQKNFLLQYAVITTFLLAITVFGIYRGDYISSEFIYKQF